MSRARKTGPLLHFEFKTIVPKSGIATIELNRPESANALNKELLEELRVVFGKITKMGTLCRLVIVQGAGPNFCAGADLEWMERATRLKKRENLKESQWLMSTFKMLHDLPVPTIALVHGACYGAGTAMAACCDWALAREDARFCLPEARLGNVAASVLPFLVNKMQPGHLRRWVLSGLEQGAAQALESGLVQSVVKKENWELAVRREIEGVLRGEPTAQAAFKRLHQRYESVLGKRPPTFGELATIFAERRITATSQRAFRAFLQKSVPDWVVTLPPNWPGR
jgi:methylglutaconyl-CoA hydratase